MSQTIELTTADGHRLAAYVATPSGKPKGAVVVAQEIFGVNAHIRSVADGYAAAGFVAIAPALFDRASRGVEMGYTADTVAKGKEIAFSQPWDTVIADVNAAIAYGKQFGKVGIVGYCWGGGIAFAAAAKAVGLSAAVCYYGGPIPKLIGEKLKVPTMMHWGAHDHMLPLLTVHAVEQAHPQAISYIYDADHGFNCDQRPVYHALAATLAKKRSVGFFEEKLA